MFLVVCVALPPYAHARSDAGPLPQYTLVTVGAESIWDSISNGFPSGVPNGLTVSLVSVGTIVLRFGDECDTSYETTVNLSSAGPSSHGPINGDPCLNIRLINTLDHSLNVELLGPSPTPTPGPTDTPTDTPAPTDTAVPTDTPTVEPSPTAGPTETPTPGPTPTAEPVPKPLMPYNPVALRQLAILLMAQMVMLLLSTCLALAAGARPLEQLPFSGTLSLVALVADLFIFYPLAAYGEPGAGIVPVLILMFMYLPAWLAFAAVARMVHSSSEGDEQ